MAYTDFGPKGNPLHTARQTAGKLARLMLGSDQDGERLAALAALQRVLIGIGKDHHHLALVIEEHLGDPPGPTSISWRSQARHCWSSRDMLNAREQDFIESMLQWRGEPTDRQAKWLAAIYQRVAGGEW